MNYFKRYPTKLELVREDSKKVGDLLLLEEFNSPKLKDWYFCHPGGLISSWCTNLGKTLNIKHAEHCFSVSGIQNMKHKLIKDLRASYRGASFPKKSPAIRSSIVMCPSQAQCGQTIRCFSSLLQWLDNSFKYCREDSISYIFIWWCLACFSLFLISWNLHLTIWKQNPSSSKCIIIN